METPTNHPSYQEVRKPGAMQVKGGAFIVAQSFPVCRFVQTPCVTVKCWTDSETHAASSQKKLTIKSMKRQAENRLRQQLNHALGSLKKCARDDIVKPDTEKLQQQLDALREENTRLQHQMDSIEELQTEIGALRTENRNLRLHVSNSTLSTETCSSLEQSTEQDQIDICRSEQTPAKVPNEISRSEQFREFNVLSCLRKVSSRRSKSVRRRYRRMFSCFSVGKSHPKSNSLSDTKANNNNNNIPALPTQCNNLQKKYDELKERNRQLQETNEMIEGVVLQLHQQIAFLSQTNQKQLEIKESSRRFFPPNVTADSPQEDDTWTLFQQSEISDISGIPIVSLEFIPSQRIAI